MLPHLFLGNVRDVLQLVDTLRTGDVGICFDTGHAYLAGNLYTATPDVARRLRMIHAHDNRGVRDDHLPPGAGKIAWGVWWRQVASSGFHGPIIIEIAARPDARAILDDAKRGLRYMNTLIADHTDLGANGR